VAEALADEEVTVTSVSLAQEGDGATLTAKLEWQGEELTATVEVGGLT
jgi:hypothetical protein